MATSDVDPLRRPGRRRRSVGAAGRDVVAITLAVGMASALNLIVAAVLWDAISSSISGLSENATQIITGAFGGILGVLGSYLGFRAGEHAAAAPPDDDPPDV